MNIKLRNVLLGSFILLAGMASIGVNVLDNNYISTTYNAKAVEEGEVFTINLNNVDATTAGSTTIYEKYGVNYYSDAECTISISSINLPTKTNSAGLDAVFGGYYTEQGGQGTQIIDAEGVILSSITAFTENTTLYAKWTVTFTFDPNEYQGGSGTPFNREAVLNGGKFYIPTKESFRKLGYKLNKDNAWNSEKDGSSQKVYLWLPGPISGEDVKSLYENGANVFYANWASKEDDVAVGAKNFNNDIAAKCDEKGISTDLTSLRYKWNEWEIAVSEDDKYWLTEGRSAKEDILAMLKKYDYILSKYGYDTGEEELHDFLGRKPTVKNAVNQTNIFYQLRNNNDNTILIVIILSSISLITITGLSVVAIRKGRKKNNKNI